MKTMTIGGKVSWACATLVALTILLGASAILTFSRVNRMTETIVSDSLPGNYFGGRLNAGIKKMMVWMAIHIQSESPEEMTRLEKLIAKRHKQWQGERREYQKLIGAGEDSTPFEKAGAAYDRIMRAWEKMLPLSRAQQNKEAFAVYHDEAIPAFEELDKQVNVLVNSNRKAGEDLGQAVMEANAAGRIWVWGVLLLSVLSGGALAFFIVRGLNASLRQAATELAQGAAQVASAADQVATGSQSLAQANSEQASSLEETAASSEEINSMTRRNTENSGSAATLMAHSQERFTETSAALGEMVTAIGEINASSDKISKIIKVIDEIAFQTNILALNAAVEAARAGEAGMGFAVVANEVRNLAQRSAQAAKDTATLIEESIATSNHGKSTVNRMAEAFRGIAEEASKIKTLVDEVHLGSQEQSRGIEQVTKAISQMEELTQKSAANAEESAAAAEELTAQSQTLKDVVSHLNAMVGAAGSVERSPTAVRRVSPVEQPRRSPETPPAFAKPRGIDKRALPLEGDFKEF